jgi:glycosyltransferase involved in cell wall biosynthesis
MTEEGLVSIIILSYKNINAIIDTLQSVINQRYEPIEVIFADDGSEGFNSVTERILKMVSDSTIKRSVILHADTNQGTVKNVNGALKEARGEYIKLLAAEDELSNPDAISDYVSFVNETEASVVFARMVGVTLEGEYRKKLISCESNYDRLKSYDIEEQKNRLFARNYLPAPAAFFQRKVFDQYGFFDEDIRLIEDYPYWLMLSCRGVKFYYLDKFEVVVRLSGVSSSGSYSEMFMNDMNVIYKKYIFPYDCRFGILQKPYNSLKKMGLRFYMEKARLSKYSRIRRVCFYILYLPFIIYSGWINRSIERKNRK